MKFPLFSRAGYIRELVLLWGGMQGSFIVQIIHLERRSRFDGAAARHFGEMMTVLLLLALSGLTALYRQKKIERQEALQAIAAALIVTFPAIGFCICRLL